MSVRVLAPSSQKILNLVLSLGLQAGARLPSERRLSERLGWSRNTVREALAGLAAQGLVEIRPCSGAYLCEGGSPHANAEDLSSLTHAAEALGLIAPALAATTCTQCDNEALARLEASTMLMGQALVDDNLDSVWQGLVAFYHELIVLGGNPLILDFMDTLGDTAPPPDSSSPVSLGEALQPFFSAHIELLHAIRSRDAEACTVQAGNSLSAFSRFIAFWRAGATTNVTARLTR